MTQLALDDVDRYAFAGKLDGMRMAQLMGSEPPADASVDGELTQFGSGGGRRPAAPSGGSVDDAQQRPWRQYHAVRHPRGELFKPELVHSDFAAFVTLCCAGNYVALRSCVAGGFALTGAAG